MIEVIPPQQPVTAKIAMPGSKSITNRVFLLAALAQGTTTLHNVLESDDTHHMQTALKAMGVSITKENLTYTIEGKGGQFTQPSTPLFLGNAGTATRFLTAALSTCSHPSTLTGDERMQERPIKPLAEALTQLGATINFNNNTDCPPLTVQGPLKGGTTTIPGNISSQYISALMMAAPLAEQDTTIVIEGELISKPYIDITIACMKDFGVEVSHENYQNFHIKHGQTYQAWEYHIEGDASAATYFWSIAALTQGTTAISNIGENALQGDTQFTDVIKQMGAQIEKTAKTITVKGTETLSPLGTIDLNHIPDAAMTVAILCAFTNGTSTLTGLHNLRIKECDRLNALATELTKIGVQVEEHEDGLTIHGNPEILHGAEIETYHDHRMAMCFAVAGTRVPGIKIKDPGCTSKTYPHFWEDLEKTSLTLSRHH